MSEEKHKDKNKKEPAKDMEIDIPVGSGDAEKMKQEIEELKEKIEENEKKLGECDDKYLLFALNTTTTESARQRKSLRYSAIRQ